MNPTDKDLQELRAKLREIIKSPMRSQVSTADIAVGMWSSTELAEKLGDIEALFTTLLAERERKARVDELQIIPRTRSIRAYIDNRLAELESQNAD